MAYIDQAQKSSIAANLKKIVPAGWKYSLAIRNHSTLVLTITQAPVDLLGEYISHVNANRARRGDDPIHACDHRQVNRYYLEEQFSGQTLEIMSRILSACMEGNHDNSDSQTDYFDVGWYVDINLGAYGRPFVCTSREEVAA